MDEEDQMSETTGVEKLTELIGDIHIAMLTTVDGDGHLNSRPMGRQQVDDDATLWFVTERDSDVVSQIETNSHVGVTLSSSDVWISIDGDAEIVIDPERAERLWNPMTDAWMPQGPRDPSVVLIKIDAHTGQYWDTPGSRVATALSLVKAKLTGERADVGESDTVTL